MIKYIIGDATNPQYDGIKLIIHICNNVGGFGSGFAGAVSRKWPEVRKFYKKWYYSKKDFKLGNVQFIQINDELYIANMIAQNGYSTITAPAIRYNELENCLIKVCEFAKENNMTIHGPRLGAGLAGGDWDIIENVINKSLNDLEIFIYDLLKGKHNGNI